MYCVTPSSSKQYASVISRTTWGIDLLDTIITDMEVRFNDFNREAAKLLFLVRSIISNDDNDFDEEAFRETLEFYSTDIPDSSPEAGIRTMETKVGYG